MNEQLPIASNEGTDGWGSTLPERRPANQPRIYVASLSDYNAGRLHGAWLDADADVEDLGQAIGSMLATSAELGAEEYAIHDYEGFGPLRIGEYESIGRIAAVAKGIVNHGLAFAHWAALAGTEDDTLSNFGDAFLGHFESRSAYAESLVDDLGWLKELEESVPAAMEPYVHLDVDGFARDLELGGDITTSDAEKGGIYVFDGTI
jgi:antirestriction protein